MEAAIPIFSFSYALPHISPVLMKGSNIPLIAIRHSFSSRQMANEFQL